MALFTVAELLSRRKPGAGYAVGAFNVYHMEDVQGVVAAAETEEAPVILQISEGAIRFAGLDYIALLSRHAAEQAAVPAAIQLDHGSSYNVAVKCVRAGFSSVMIDASRLPFEENIKLTAKVAQMAHAAGVSVEGELGRVGGKEDDIGSEKEQSLHTDPDEAAEFVRRTAVDTLAVAIGTVHGLYRGEPKLDFDRLAVLRDHLRLPLVLHGASDLPEELIREAVRLGIDKINIGTDLKVAGTEAIKRLFIERPGEFDPGKVFTPARDAVKELTRDRIRLFGASGKAKDF